MTHLFHVLILGLCLLTACAHVADDTLLFDEALAAAGSRGDKAKIEALLAKGFDVNSKIEHKGFINRTMLHEAVAFGTKDMIELLLAKGANINAKNSIGQTPLDWAANDRRKDIAELLLAKGADVNAMDKDGQTPLHVAAHRGSNKGSKDIGELLLAKGANINAKDKDGQTPLHLAAYSGTNDVAELLLAKGADVNAKDQNGATPLYLAASKGDTDIVMLLLAKGADVNAKNYYGAGETSLHRAASEAYWDIANLLLAKGAEVNVKDQYGATPLHRAAEKGYKSVAQLLLAKGADVSAKDKSGKTPRDSAEREGEKAVVELLNEHLANEVRLFNEQFRLQDEQRVEKARLLEEHRLKQVKLREDLIKSNPRAAFLELIAQLKGNPADDTVRRLIIKLADELKPAPAIPEEAREPFIMGTTVLRKAGDPVGASKAVELFTQALTVAPWFADAYYNRAMAREIAGQFEPAIDDLNLYLAFTLTDAERREAQDKIYSLKADAQLDASKKSEQSKIARAEEEKRRAQQAKRDVITQIKNAVRGRRYNQSFLSYSGDNPFAGVNQHELFGGGKIYLHGSYDSYFYFWKFFDERAELWVINDNGVQVMVRVGESWGPKITDMRWFSGDPKQELRTWGYFDLQSGSLYAGMRMGNLDRPLNDSEFDPNERYVYERYQPPK